MGLSANTVVQVLLRERPRITASALGILRDAHAADDVFQQVVLQALQGQEQFREPEHLLAWALRVARHRAIDALPRHATRCLDGAVLDLLEQQWTAAPAAEVSARVDALHRCLDKLPTTARELLRLRYEDGLRCNAVAERVGRTVEAVYQNLSRIHRQLRQCVEAQLKRTNGPSFGEALP
ncbi:MAG: sigma-70 family RNA polymerase sigma factor [Planctomycetia bacterium]|nr:sigma-70 family RNA polymerase sigma factor [Planctomycetia bacterium]